MERELTLNQRSTLDSFRAFLGPLNYSIPRFCLSQISQKEDLFSHL